MSARFCDRCGAKSSPWMPRVRVDQQMWCPMCAANHRVHRTGAVDRHPDIDWKVSRFGVANTSLGRAGFADHRTAATHDEQESRLADPRGWDHSGTGFKPVRFAIEGARAYSHQMHLPDPHEHDYSQVHQNADTVRTVGRLYDQLPEHDEHAVPHFEAMRDEMAAQHHFATHKMGIKFHTVDHDPYANVHEMVHDVEHNKTLKVMGTHVTGEHPFFSNEENDQFRGVHDLFGHAATGRDFSRHGEQAAFLAHSRMFSDHARPAMVSETKGQNTSLILNGHFGPQKIAMLPQQHWSSRTAAGWTGEDVVRFEMGRQKVHTVHVNGHSAATLCPEHLAMHRERSDFGANLAAQVGLPGHRFPQLDVSPRHEGRCQECALRQGDGKQLPWERPQGVGWSPPPENDRQPTQRSLMHRRPRPGIDEMAPFRPGLQSMNMRVAMACDGQDNPIRIQRVAHDSGDGETIFHCPFCGSGQVIARSDGTCECEFCSTAFTVQVQPKLPAFPQTIDGQPIDVPGMPNGGQDANVPPGGVPGDPAVSGDDAAPGDPDADPDASPDDGSEDSGDSDSSGDKPPWLKSSLLLRTDAGYRLNEEQYIRRLALQHSHNQQAVLERIRHENGVGNG